MKKLTVLFDDRCSFCLRCAAWLRRQKQLIPLELLAISDPRVVFRYPTLVRGSRIQDLIVVSDCGSVYSGSNAFVMALYALRDYRIWSMRLATPELTHLAKAAFDALSKRRRALSWFIGKRDDARILAELRMANGAIACKGVCV